MTEKEICRTYREAKKQNTQLQILAELNGMSRVEIITILVRNGEELPHRTIKQLYKRLDDLEKQISVREREYREIMVYQWMIPKEITQFGINEQDCQKGQNV